eukprot:2726168-Rhodomonas_salina.3
MRRVVLVPLLDHLDQLSGLGRSQPVLAPAVEELLAQARGFVQLGLRRVGVEVAAEEHEPPDAIEAVADRSLCDAFPRVGDEGERVLPVQLLLLEVEPVPERQQRVPVLAVSLG